MTRPRFSLHALCESNQGLFRHLTWASDNDWTEVSGEDLYIHMGCESHVLPGFVNLDFIPCRPEVIEWDALSRWPDRLNGKVKVFYSEDFIEHFFLNEQLYLYCSMNCLLKDGGTVRTLTPNMEMLWQYGQSFDLEDCLRRGDDYYVSIMRCRDGMDAVNMGMRMGGHRWLHTPESLSRVALACGFAPQHSTCALSSDPKMCGINIRMEYGNGISFALEMVKKRPLKRVVVPPAGVLNAEHVESISPDQQLYRATTIDPAVVYEFSALNAGDIALVNIRGANLSQYREHNFAKSYFRRNEAGGIYVDRTLQSVPYMNIFNRVDLQTALADQMSLESIRFDPGEREGEYFTVGPLELFVFTDRPEEAEKAVLLPDEVRSGSTLSSVPANTKESEAVSYTCRHGEMLCLPLDQPIARSLEVYGEWAQREVETLCAFLPVGGTVLDAGAHVGLHALAFARHTGRSGRVLAVEPQEKLFALLEENIRRNGWENVITPLHAALSDAPGSLYVPPCGTLCRPRNLAGLTLNASGPGQPVTALTVDELALTSLDMLKIDAEGSSAAVLLGAAATLERLKPVVALECSEFLIGRSAFHFLSSQGYCCYYCSFSAYNPRNARGEQWNIFGMAEEGMLFAFPEDRTDLRKSLPKGARPVLSEADLIRSCWGSLRYGGLPLRGTEPWHLIRAWAEERRMRKMQEVNEIFASLNSQAHAERAKFFFDAYAERNEFLCRLEQRARELEKAQEGAGLTGVWDESCSRTLRKLLALPAPALDERKALRFDPPLPPRAEEWEAFVRTRSGECGREPDVDVIVPVYNAFEYAAACLYSVLTASSSTPFRLLVIDDASSDERLISLLRSLEAWGLLELRSHMRNEGFVRSANEGMEAHGKRDVVLLNSDTLVFPGWLDRLRACAQSGERIGTVTPLSNNATIYSYPAVSYGSSHVLPAESRILDELAAVENAGLSLAIPTAVGFCMYIARSCLDEVGYFDAQSFGRGYGEENDFCLRAARRGWEHRLALDVYVWHEGERSFGDEAPIRREEAYELLCARYPHYKEMIGNFLRQTPLEVPFRRLTRARFRNHFSHSRKMLLFVTHNWGGGTEREMQAMTVRLKEQGIDVLIMRPVDNVSQCRVSLNNAEGLLKPEELSFHLPGDLGALAATLADFGVAHVHVHCLAGYHAAMPDVIRLLCRLTGVEYDYLASDFLSVCPRAHAVDPEGRYCGIRDARDCSVCLQKETPWCGGVDIHRWRERYATFIQEARRLFVPSADMASRIRSWFSGCRPLVRPYPELLSPVTPSPATLSFGASLHVLIIGAIGPHKGMTTLLSCARDAQSRRLPLRFSVLGYTCDDAAAAEAGIVVTGRYDDTEALSHLKNLGGQVAFLPSIWPETYCYTLSLAALAGLFPVTFDLGAQAERIRNWNWGFCLPLEWAGDGAAINNTLLELEISPPPADIVARITEPGRFAPNYFQGYYDLPLSLLEV